MAANPHTSILLSLLFISAVASCADDFELDEPTDCDTCDTIAKQPQARENISIYTCSLTESILSCEVREDVLEGLARDISVDYVKVIVYASNLSTGNTGLVLENFQTFEIDLDELGWVPGTKIQLNINGKVESSTVHGPPDYFYTDTDIVGPEEVVIDLPFDLWEVQFISPYERNYAMITTDGTESNYDAGRSYWAIIAHDEVQTVSRKQQTTVTTLPLTGPSVFYIDAVEFRLAQPSDYEF